MLRKLNRFMKIVREVNLEAIRQRAQTSLPLLIVAESASDRDAVASVLTGNGAPGNPWLHMASLGEAETTLANHPAGLAVLVSRTGDPAGLLEPVTSALAARKVPVVAVSVGQKSLFDRGASWPRGHKPAARLLVPSLEPAGSRDSEGHPLATTLFSVVQPDARLALARQFPGLRKPLFDDLIQETSKANASYALSTGLAEIVPLLDIPLNIGDVIILTKNQLLMAYRMALAAGKEGRPRDIIGELVGVLGGGLLFRQVARELIGLVPVIGIVPKVVVAYTGTWAIGQAVAAWVTGGELATARSLERFYAAGLERGRQTARQLTTRATA